MKTVTIDCTAITDPADLHKALFEALEFDEWYGHNLDALYDCLTEAEGIALHLAGWNTSLPWAAGFESVFADAARDNPDFQVVL